MFNIKKFFVNLLGLTYYTSGLDQFLEKRHEMHPVLSASQQQEKTKYQRIFHLRDVPNSTPSQPLIWSKFLEG